MDQGCASDLPAGLPDDGLFGDVASLIEGARGRVAVTVNAELTMLYWGIGRRIRQDVLGLEKPQYGRAVVTRLAERLTARYGRGYSRGALFRMVQFAAIYEAQSIVATLSRQLTWSHLVQLIALSDVDERRFYESLAARDHWSVRTLSQQIRRALSRMREALSVCVDENVACDQLDPCVHLPAEARLVVARYQSANKRLQRDQREAHSATDRAIETLVGELSLSVRDARDVLGLSHQRVHQLVGARPR